MIAELKWSDLKVIFKLLSYFILCFLIVLLIEHSSQNWGREFMKQCCSCEIKGEKRCLT